MTTRMNTPGRSTTPRRPVVVNAYDIDATVTRSLPLTSFNRTSLRAIIAGALVALVIMTALSVLGIAIGATTLDALIDFNDDPAFDPATGVIVWLAVTNLVALFAGGWVAGRLAGVPDETDGALHGIVTWGLVSLISLWMFTTATGRIVNGAADAVGLGLDAIGAGVETVVPAASDAVRRQEFTLEDIRAEARSLLTETQNPSLQPDALGEQSDEAGQIVQGTAEGILQEPSSAGDQISNAVDRLLSLDAPSDAERQDLVNIIVANTDMTEQEARDTINNWETRYNETNVDVEGAINDASEAVTDAIAQAAAVVFMAMVIGAFAAGAGGYFGAPDLKDLEDTLTPDTEEAAA